MADYKFAGKWLGTALPEKCPQCRLQELIIFKFWKKAKSLSVCLIFYFSDKELEPTPTHMYSDFLKSRQVMMGLLKNQVTQKCSQTC